MGNSDNVIAVVLADDHHIVRSALRAALASAYWQNKMPNRVVAEAENGLEAIAEVKQYKPNLLFLDVAMPLAGGAEVVHEVERWSPDTKAVVFTGVNAPAVLAGLVDTRVHGLFHKSTDLASVLTQVPLILKGAHVVDDRIKALLGVGRANDSLTRRERQVLNLLIGGQSNREIGGTLGISPKTVDKHRTSIMAKLDVHSFAELMRHAISHGLIEQLG